MKTRGGFNNQEMVDLMGFNMIYCDLMGFYMVSFNGISPTMAYRTSPNLVWRFSLLGNSFINAGFSSHV
jgi:hypothetical protein